MEATKSLKQLRGFIGMDNYYRDMWPHQANVLAPPTAKIGNKKCYLSLPDDLITDNPLDMENINKNQDADNALQQQAENYPDRSL